MTARCCGCCVCALLSCTSVSCTCVCAVGHHARPTQRVPLPHADPRLVRGPRPLQPRRRLPARRARLLRRVLPHSHGGHEPRPGASCRRQGTAAAPPIDLSSPLLCPQAHDSCAVLAITHPHLFTEAARVCVDVECTGTVTLGVTVADLRGHVESRDDEEAGGDGSASPAARRRRTNVTVLLRAESDAARAAMVDLIGAYSR